MTKPRRFDLYPDDFIAGIAGRFDPDELGMFLVALLLIYSHGGATDDDVAAIARLFRTAKAVTVNRLLDRLVAAGKLSRQDGAITSPRASGEIAKALARTSQAVANGKNGGRLRGKTNTYQNRPVLATEKLPSPSPSPSPKESPQPPKGDESFFSEFWQHYPRKVGRGAAVKAYRSALAKTSPETLQTAVQRFASECAGKDPQFVPHAATWLNAERWSDDPAATGNTDRQSGERKSKNPVVGTPEWKQAQRDAGVE